MAEDKHIPEQTHAVIEHPELLDVFKAEIDPLTLKKIPKQDEEE